jgi:hypothetical protein
MVTLTSNQPYVLELAFLFPLCRFKVEYLVYWPEAGVCAPPLDFDEGWISQKSSGFCLHEVQQSSKLPFSSSQISYVSNIYDFAILLAASWTYSTSLNIRKLFLAALYYESTMLCFPLITFDVSQFG